MPIVETFSVALEALRANKLRSLLTMLGIVIGVSAVIAMLALGRGAQQSVKDRIAQLGTTMLTVVPGQQRGPGSIASATERARLTLDDAQALEDRGKVLAAVLGLDPDAVRAALESQKSAARARKAAAAGDSTAAGGTAAVGGTGGVASDSLSTHGGKHGGKHKHKHANDGSRGGAAAADGSAADGSSGGGSSGGGSSGGGSSGGSSSRSQVVFVKSATGIEPRRVKLGLSDFDFSQVTSGVEEGEQVVMLGLVQAQAARVKQQAKAREKAAGSMPGGLGSQGSGSSKKGGGV
ncbi:MAG: hypothetical protein E6K72_04260 [Candidatus Eisenbacteria bacterium]|uniref:Uncharacterized protein n=1 Tax=Eiseniibacteriota bacterium TaxID=2212470 RepID=A0A538SZQ1_UNCEI|nr:MAG: hypothetical protein E6K72_04260 [Candidatus Eisenbacteria bacterium]